MTGLNTLVLVMSEIMSRHYLVCGIPKLIFGQLWVIPKAYNTDDIVMILQNSLAVPGFLSVYCPTLSEIS